MAESPSRLLAESPRGRSRAGGFHQNLEPRQEKAHGGPDFVVGHVVSRAAGFLHGPERVETIGGRADGQRFGNCIGLFSTPLPRPRPITYTALMISKRPSPNVIEKYNLQQVLLA